MGTQVGGTVLGASPLVKEFAPAKPIVEPARSEYCTTSRSSSLGIGDPDSVGDVGAYKCALLSARLSNAGGACSP
jgi:hypothetical protein